MRYWSEKYKLSRKVLFELYSEFIAMLQLSKYDQNTSKNPLKKLFPLDHSVKMS